MQDNTYTLDEVRELLGLGPTKPLGVAYDMLDFAGWRDGVKVWRPNRTGRWITWGEQACRG